MFKRLEFIGGCQNCQTVGHLATYYCCFALDSKITVDWIGKCSNSDKTAYCTSYTRTTTFNCVSITGSSPDQTVRWEFTENGQTSWIQWNRNTDFTWSFKAIHFPHYNFGATAYYCDTTGCTCDTSCNPVPFGDIEAQDGELVQYRLIDTPLPEDFCDGDSTTCVDLDPFLCINAVVSNCSGENVDPQNNDYCPGFFLQVQPCCVAP